MNAIRWVSAVFLVIGVFCQTLRAELAFDGPKSSWHGFDRYDFVLDDQTLTVKPFKAASNEGDGLGNSPEGTRRCVIVVPKQVAAGNPWSWRGCYWDHQPQTEIELLKRGFCVAYITANSELKPDKGWDAWYAFLTEQHGLSKKPTFIGMSRGGEYAYTWAVRNPDKVTCIYADNPAANAEVFAGLGGLAAYDVPLLHVCGSMDPLLGKFSTAIETIYQQLGGRISVMIKEGYGHHPHSLNDPKPLADFIEQSVREMKAETPALVGKQSSKSYYYSSENFYREFPSQGTYLTCRGPLFVPCYERYEFGLPGVDAFNTVLLPGKPAAGKPWVLRADRVWRDAVVEQSLLARGFAIVTGAVPYNGDGPQLNQWKILYDHLLKNGFAKKPVLMGEGGAGGEIFAWAEENPDKVSCIYVENPVMRTHMSKTQPLDALDSLAKAKVPVLVFGGAQDPWFKDNTQTLAQRYQQLGGPLTLSVVKDRGHYPTRPQDPQAVVDFILANSK